MSVFLKNLILIFLLVVFSSCAKTKSNDYLNNKNMFQKVRQASVAGSFYPDNSFELEKDINKYLNYTGKHKIKHPKAFIVPHAGYVFSASYAGKAFSFLKDKNIENVFLVSNAHSEFFQGIAIDSNDVWENPLGKVFLNKNLIKKIVSKNDNIFLSDSAHKNDHTLEVQIPFLQKIISSDFKIIPILF